MITKVALSLLTTTYKIACYINAVPYQWDSVNRKLVHTTSYLRLAIFYFNIFGEWFYTGFKIVRLVYAYKNVSFFVVIIHAGWLSRDILLSAFHLTSIMRRNEVPEFFNKLRQYDQEHLVEFAKKQKLDKVPVGTDWCKLYHLGISFPVSASFPFFLALFGWALAPHPQFLASLFSPDGIEHPSFDVKLTMLIFELWIGYTSFFACYFYTCTLFCVIQSMRFSLRLLSLPPQPEVDYADSVRRSKKLFRTLQILNVYLNACWRSIIAPVQQSVDLILGATYTCGFIKFRETMGMVTLFCFVYQVLAVAGCTSSTYSIAGRLPQWTARVFSNWKHLDLERVKDEDEYETVDDEKLTMENEKKQLLQVPGGTGMNNREEGTILVQSQFGENLSTGDTKLGLASISVKQLIISKLCQHKRSAHGMHLKLFLRSCRPLHMKTGCFFTVSREYGLGWFSWYVENTVSLTLAFKDK